MSVSSQLEYCRAESVRNGPRAKLGLLASGLFAIAFLAAQLALWQRLSASGLYVGSGAAVAFFYLLTGLHGLHLAGGLIVWDRLAGTLYVPKPDEHLVYGASLEELGENNPHRTLWRLLLHPFVAAAKTLRRRTPPDGTAASHAAAAT